MKKTSRSFTDAKGNTTCEERIYDDSGKLVKKVITTDYCVSKETKTKLAVEEGLSALKEITVLFETLGVTLKEKR